MRGDAQFMTGCIAAVDSNAVPPLPARMRHVLFSIIVLLPLASQARPVSFPGGVMAMSMNDHMQYSQSLSYSPTARDAFGANLTYLREDDVWLETVSYNRLLKRWNRPGSQANIYLLSGVGAAQRGDESSPAATLGMEADWESRRYYASYENRYLYAGPVERMFTQQARIGFAPVQRAYHEPQPWLMLQVDYHPTLRDNVVVTPLVRIFTPQALGEFGISNRGDVLANAVFQF